MKFRARVFKESVRLYRGKETWWIGQCMDVDICVQSKTEKGVINELKGMFAAYKQLGYPIKKIPRPPLYAHSRPGKIVIFDGVTYGKRRTVQKRRRMRRLR